MKPQNQERVIIENISPCIDGGIFALKTIAQQPVFVEADILADGHDHLYAVLQFKAKSDNKWSEILMSPLGNDRWGTTMLADKEGTFEYFIESWVDWPLNWLFGTRKKIDADQHVKSELLEGAEYITDILKNLKGKTAMRWDDKKKRYMLKKVDREGRVMHEKKNESGAKITRKMKENQKDSDSIFKKWQQRTHLSLQKAGEMED